MSELAFEKFLEDHRDTLEALFASSGAAAWSVSLDEFARVAWRGIARAATAEPRKISELLLSLRIRDLALALGCQAGNEQAWHTFSFEYRGVLYEAAHAILRDEVLAHELADSLFSELYGLDSSKPGRDSKLAYFHGRSSLKTWLRSVLYQRFVDEYRRQSHLESLDEGAPDPVTSTGPVSESDESRYDGYLSEAVEAALRDLPSAEKLLLSYAYVQQLTLKQIGRLRGEHEATVSRHLKDLRKKLKKRIQRHLRSVRKLSAYEVDRCLDFAARGLSVDLDRVLKSD